MKYSKRYDLGFGKLISADDDMEEQEKPKESEPEKEQFELFDMHRPLEGDCTIELFNFEDPLGKSVGY